MFKIFYDKKRWNDFLWKNFEFPYYTQIYEWMEVLVKTFQNLEMYPLVWEENGEIKDIIPFIYDKNSKILFSPSPFGGLGGLLNPKLYQILIKEITEKFSREKKINYIQVFSPKKINSGFKLFSQPILMQINLTGDKILFSRSFIQRLKKSQKLGVKIDIVNNLGTEKINWIYQLYYQTMIKNKAKLIFPKELFQNIFLFFKKYLVFFECILSDGTPIGYNIAFFFKNSIFSFFSIIDYNYKQYAPGVRLFYEMINFAREHNLKIVDYGPDAIGTGTYEFKKRAGAKPIFYYHYIYSLNPVGHFFIFKHRVKKFLIKILKR